MLGKMSRLTRYKVCVLNLKPRRYSGSGDELFINERDVFFGYGYKLHRVGKYFDLWFNDPKEKDPENFVTFGRILRIEPPMEGSGLIYVTKFGRFYVQEMNDEDIQLQGQGAKSSERSEEPDHAALSRFNIGRCDRNIVGADGGGSYSFRKSQGVSSDQH